MIYPITLPHSVQRNLISNPPEGYKFNRSLDELRTELSNSGKMKVKLSQNKLLKSIWEFSKKFHNPILKRYESMKRINNSNLVKTSDLIFSGEILPTDKPYWIDLEHVRQLMGWDINLFKKNREWIADKLSEPNCRLITSWTKAGIDTVTQNLPDSQRFRHKCYFVHNAVSSVKFKRKFSNKKDVTFLFMSSYDLPYDFNFKGGNVVLEAFSRMYARNKNIKLIVKAWVPEKIMKNYSSVTGIDFQGISPFSEMDKIFKQCDIFMSPNHNTPAQAYLDCMNYSIPIITTDLWANSEIIKDNYNGLLIPKSKKVPYFFGNNIPASRSPAFNKAINEIDEELVKNLVNKAETLIDNWKLRKKLGENGKRELNSGEFSIKTRNLKYKKLLDKYFK